MKKFFAMMFAAALFAACGDATPEAEEKEGGENTEETNGDATPDAGENTSEQTEDATSEAGGTETTEASKEEK
tara:strand:- start:141 stop:359 length:219 start_codon:yes stop_codon:yes gene_type:complete